MNNKTLLTIITFISLIGIITSGYMAVDHYRAGHLSSGVCDTNGLGSCSIVNTSEYSEIFGIPAGILGVIWFVGLAYLSIRLRSIKHGRKELLWFTILGLLFVAYFIWAEIQLYTICSICTFVHVLVLITFIIALILYKKQK